VKIGAECYLLDVHEFDTPDSRLWPGVAKVDCR
jgi:hypothetical protein